MLDNYHDFPSTMCSPVAVVCHDAGSANLIFAWLRDWARLGLLNQIEIRLVLDGPAYSAWQVQKISLPCVEIHAELITALTGANCVLTGTGWASELEHEARKISSLMGVQSIAVIDHWVNYSQRFERAGLLVLPDVIYVSDPYAAKIAKEEFKNIKVTELSNAYLRDMIKDIPPVRDDCNNLLYLLEPIRTDWGRGLAGEFQALNFFVENMNVITVDFPENIILRPHPSDELGKYDTWILSQPDLKFKLDQFENLKDSIANARWVVGVETYAMVVALESKRETWSSMPPWGHKCRLPQKNIKHIKDNL